MTKNYLKKSDSYENESMPSVINLCTSSGYKHKACAQDKPQEKFPLTYPFFLNIFSTDFTILSTGFSSQTAVHKAELSSFPQNKALL